MTRAARLAAALLVALLAASSIAAAQANDTNVSDDPFAEDDPLFGDEDEQDPFADLEERATLDEDEGEDDAGEDEDDADPAGSESSSAIPGPGLLATLLVVAGVGVAGRRRG